MPLCRLQVIFHVCCWLGLRFTFPSTFVFNRRMRNLNALPLLLSCDLAAQTSADKLLADDQRKAFDLWSSWASSKRGRTH